MSAQDTSGKPQALATSEKLWLQTARVEIWPQATSVEKRPSAMSGEAQTKRGCALWQRPAGSVAGPPSPSDRLAAVLPASTDMASKARRFAGRQPRDASSLSLLASRLRSLRADGW